MRLSFLSLFLLVIPAVNAQPVSLNPDNPHYLVYHGKPIIVISSGEHYGAVLNLDFDFIKYLNTLHREGMNYTRVFSGFYMETPGQFGIKNNSLAPKPMKLLTPWARSKIPGYKNQGNKFDLDQWDPGYFARLHEFVREAEKRNILVEMVLFTSIYNADNWSIHPFNPENNINHLTQTDFKKVNTISDKLLFSYQKSMVKKIVHELNSYDNIIYEIQNEPYADNGIKALDINTYDPETDKRWVRKVEIANEASLEWQHQIALIITTEESTMPKKHLIAQNYCNFKYPVQNVDPAVSIMNFHYVYPENVIMNYGYNRVISFDESGFAGSMAETYRKQAWNFVLAGGGIFNNLDYSFFPGHEDGTGENEAPGGGNINLRTQLKILRDFMEGFDFAKMKPDSNIILHSPGLLSHVLSWDGHQYAVYLEGSPGKSMTLSLPDGQYDLIWVDTESGRHISGGILEAGDQPSIVQLPEFKNSIALKIVVR